MPSIIWSKETIRNLWHSFNRAIIELSNNVRIMCIGLNTTELWFFSVFRNPLGQTWENASRSWDPCHVQVFHLVFFTISFQRHLHSTHKHTRGGSNCRNSTRAIVECSKCNHHSCPCAGSADTVILPIQGNKGSSTMHITTVYTPLFPQTHTHSFYQLHQSHHCS